MEGRYEDIPSDIYIKYFGNLKKIKIQSRQDPIHLPENTVLAEWWYGDSRTGKSHAAREELKLKFNGEEPYDKPCNTKWWCGYNDEQGIIIDDIEPSHAYMLFYLKRWLDRYTYIAETKNGHFKIRPKYIIITSNYHPNQIWPGKTELDPIMQRFAKLVRFQKTPFTETMTRRVIEEEERISPLYGINLAVPPNHHATNQGMELNNTITTIPETPQEDITQEISEEERIQNDLEFHDAILESLNMQTNLYL